MIYREPKNLIIQIEDRHLGQIIPYWTYYKKPCSFYVRSANTEGMSAVVMRMDNADTASFVFILCERLKARMYDQETKKELTVQDVFM